MKKNLIVLIFLSLLNSCSDAPFVQPKVLDNNSMFDLEQITFNEDIPTLYSKNFVNDYKYDMEEEYNATSINADTIFKYQISDAVTDVLKIKVPVKDFGYLYKSTQLDSVAKFQQAYFNSLDILTDINKKPVAYYAEAEFKNSKERKQFLDNLIQQFGQPKYAFFISHEYNVCSYEWDLPNQTIQIETSYGHGVTISTTGDFKNEVYYRLDMLIINNQTKTAIEEAHQYILPDMITGADGKTYSIKELGMDKESKIKDDFLLNSTFDHYINDINGEYHISRARNDDE